MRQTQFVILILTLLIITTPALSDFQVLQSKRLEFKAAETDRSVFPDSFKIHLDAETITLNKSGKGEIESKGKPKRIFKIPLPGTKHGSDFIEKVIFGFDRNFLFLLYEISDGEGAISKLSKIDLGTYKILWTNTMSGFNPWIPLNKANSLYVTATGFIGKINLDTGKYSWKHVGFYERASSAFNSFIKPEIKEGTVIFTEETHKERKPFQIIVDDKSGKIIRIIRTE